MATMAAIPVQQGFQGFSVMLEGALRHTSTSESLAESHAASSHSLPLAPETLVEQNLSLVHAIARKLHRGLPRHIEIDDLVSAGMLGLVDAAARFRSDRETQFRTFAQLRIRGAMMDSLRDLDWGSRDQRRQGRDIEQAIAAASRRLGRTPDHNDIALEMGVDLTQLQTMLADLKGLELGSLQTERNEDSGEEEIAYLAGEQTEEPLFRCLEGELKQHLIDAIEALPERERLVITLYFYEELSLREVAEVLGVGESRVSQLKSSAVLRLRTALAKLR